VARHEQNEQIRQTVRDERPYRGRPTTRTGQAESRALGIFTDDRELLECPSCGWSEDVMFEGLLGTYPKGSADLKDCGLRLKRAGKTSFECPMCGTRIKAVIS
jgi:predicted RNA-binding Zn-ribbon protein involved in translation (DUF1610 family)